LEKVVFQSGFRPPKSPKLTIFYHFFQNDPFFADLGRFDPFWAFLARFNHFWALLAPQIGQKGFFS